MDFYCCNLVYKEKESFFRSSITKMIAGKNSTSSYLAKIISSSISIIE